MRPFYANAAPCGVIRCCTVPYGVVRFLTVLHGAVRCCTAPYSAWFVARFVRRTMPVRARVRTRRTVHPPLPRPMNLPVLDRSYTGRQT